MHRLQTCSRNLQGLPYDEPYVAVFENMDTVVFFNGCGQEAQLWQQYAGAVLPTREIEGRASHASSSGDWQELLDVGGYFPLSLIAVCTCVGCAIDTGPEACVLKVSQPVCKHRDSAKWLAKCNARFSFEFFGCHVQLSISRHLGPRAQSSACLCARGCPTTA